MLSNLFKAALTFSFLDGYKSYLAAIGLIGLGVYQISTGDVNLGLTSIGLGLTGLGLRHSNAKIEEKVDKTDLEIKATLNANTLNAQVEQPKKYSPAPAALEKTLAAILVLLACGGIATAGDEIRVRVAIAIAQAHVADVPSPSISETYIQARDAAEKAGKPIVVWVGQPASEVAGTVGVSVDSFPGVTGQGVVIGTPANGKMLRWADLPGRVNSGIVTREVRLFTTPISRADCPDGNCPLAGPITGVRVSGLSEFNGFRSLADCPTCPKRR